ncbi:SEL1-like repeat protein, partial [Clostridium saudiense]|nr:SEL1-like repeat protein [Clostridium saudiense]
KSIECGNTNIFFKVAKIYEDENMIDEAITIYEMGSKEGDLKCIQRLGIMYYNGELVKRDTEKAIKYIEIAAENRAPHAMYMLAIAYLRVNKFGEDTTRIVKKLLEEAYELKSQFAAEYLAFLMLADKKDGKDINEKKLLEYLEFGFINGVVGSLFQYGYIY